MEILWRSVPATMMTSDRSFSCALYHSFTHTTTVTVDVVPKPVFIKVEIFKLFILIYKPQIMDACDTQNTSLSSTAFFSYSV